MPENINFTVFKPRTVHGNSVNSKKIKFAEKSWNAFKKGIEKRLEKNIQRLQSRYDDEYDFVKSEVSKIQSNGARVDDLLKASIDSIGITGFRIVQKEALLKRVRSIGYKPVKLNSQTYAKIKKAIDKKNKMKNDYFNNFNETRENLVSGLQHKDYDAVASNLTDISNYNSFNRPSQLEVKTEVDTLSTTPVHFEPKNIYQEENIESAYSSGVSAGEKAGRDLVDSYLERMNNINYKSATENTPAVENEKQDGPAVEPLSTEQSNQQGFDSVSFIDRMMKEYNIPTTEPIAQQAPVEVEPVVTEPIVQQAPVEVEPVVPEPIAQQAPVEVKPVVPEPIVQQAPVEVKPVVPEPIAQQAPVEVKPVVPEPIVQQTPVEVEPVVPEPISEENNDNLLTLRIDKMSIDELNELQNRLKQEAEKRQLELERRAAQYVPMDGDMDPEELRDNVLSFHGDEFTNKSNYDKYENEQRRKELVELEIRRNELRGELGRTK